MFVIETLIIVRYLNAYTFYSYYSLIANKLVELLEKYIPASKVRDGRYKNNPYVNSSGLEAIKKKHTRWLKYQYNTI